LWKDFQSRFDNIIESLKKQRDFVDMEAASLDIVEAKDSRARLQYEIERRKKESNEALERNEKNERIARLQHSVEWLSVDDTVQETEYERMSRRRHDGTCEWIYRVVQMNNWLKNDTKHPLLWLSGKPGAGMMSMYTS
jgi:transposase